MEVVGVRPVEPSLAIKSALPGILEGLGGVHNDGWEITEINNNHYI